MLWILISLVKNQTGTGTGSINKHGARTGASISWTEPPHSDTPMLQFLKRLHSKGLKITLLSCFIRPGWLRPPPTIAVVDISGDAPQPDRDPLYIFEFLNQLSQVVRTKLPQVVADNERQGDPVSCLVYDSIIPWAMDVATQSGLRTPLFTQSCSANAILYASHLKAPLDSFLPPLDVSDLPSSPSDSTSFAPIMGLLTDQFSNLHRARRVLFNSFDALEPQLVKQLSAHWPLMLVGPTIPSLFLNKRLDGGSDYGVGLFQAEEDGCREWLDLKGDESVVYVAFGSLVSMGEEQMAEIAMGLINSGKKFLWVVRDTEVKKLPTGFVEETKERGLVVNWCHQLHVLNYRAVGCFVSHCGWNSMLEALCLGVPVIGIPSWSDQPTNAKFVADVWQVGLRAKPDRNGIVSRQQIEHSIREVMEGERGQEIKINSLKWKQLAKAAIDDGSSSDANIQRFVDSLNVSL